MATLLVTLLAALAACGSSDSSTQVGGPCLANNTCSAEQICDLTDPGGAVCVDSTGDLDSDGIPNGKDFCQHLAGGDHDEDIDGIGDECDPCPIARPPAAADSDGDAVDGACDPDTRTPGDKIILFNGFNAAVAGASAAWRFQGGAAIVTPSGPATIEQLVFPISGGTSHMSIHAVYRIDSVTAGATQSDAGVMNKSILPLGTSSVQCGGTRRDGSDALSLVQAGPTSASTESTDAVRNAFNPASQYQVLQVVERGMTNCALAGDTEDDSGVVQLGTDGSVPTQAVLYARGATVRFAYLLVTARP